MKVLEQITMTVKAAFTEWFPSFLKMELGVIGKFFDTFGYARAIIIGIFAALMAIFRWVWKRLNH